MILASFFSDWSAAGAVMTFAIPVGLFVIVSIVLYFQYTRPHTVPGHRNLVPAGAGAAAAPAAAAPAAAGPPTGPAPAVPAEAGSAGATGDAGMSDVAGGAGEAEDTE
jgi:hypothetical protein